MGDYETVVGLECHVELSTATKMFCGCRNTFGAEPNTNTCPVCLGHPGSLPVPNAEAIERIMKIGLALNCEVAERSVFARKNYFYPDMPKNFQITQFDLPTCVHGHLDVEVDGEVRTIGITRVHMEEDTGKTSHGSASGRIHEADSALIDFNRAGVPLVEIVSEPDIRSAAEAAAYLRELRATVGSLEVSDVRMEEGSLRCDANVSVRAPGESAFGTRVEIKNMNSVRSLERAIRYEADRQWAALAAGESITQETRHWNEDEGRSIPMRSKEEAFDYRYFPEPDLSPLVPEHAHVERLRAELPELPAARRARYEGDLALKPATAASLVAAPDLAALFDETVELGAPPALAANWITQDFAGMLNEHRLTVDDVAARVTAGHLVDLVAAVEDGTISGAGGKAVLAELFDGSVPGGDPDGEEAVEGPSVAEVIDAKGLRQVSDTGELGAIVDRVIDENPDPVAKFRAGNEQLVGFLVGQVMKASGGTANPKLAQELLRERLSG